MIKSLTILTSIGQEERHAFTSVPYVVYLAVDDAVAVSVKHVEGGHFILENAVPFLERVWYNVPCTVEHDCLQFHTPVFHWRDQKVDYPSAGHVRIIVGIEDGHLASKNHQIYLIFKRKEGKEINKDKDKIVYSIVGIEDGHLASKNHQIYLIFKRREGKETDKIVYS